MTRLGSNDQIKKVLEMIAIRHLKVDRTDDTIVGTDNGQEFFRALRKDSETWICTYHNTKTVKWND